jgi:integrase
MTHFVIMSISSRHQIDAESINAFLARQTYLAPSTRLQKQKTLRVILKHIDDPADDDAILEYFSGIRNNNTYNLKRVILLEYREYLNLPALDLYKRRSTPREIRIEHIKLAYEAILSGENHDVHKMALLLLRWAGIRAGELLSIRPRDIEFDQHSAILSVSGKTGPRRVRCLEVTADLRSYINSHKFEPDAPIIPLEYIGLYMFLHEASKRFKTTIRLTPHLLRHLRATEMARKLREPAMRIYFGWARNSPMPAVYVHLSGADCDDQILENAGIVASAPKVTSRVCPRCQSPNQPDMKFCGLCGQNLDGLNLDLQREIRESPTDALLKRLEKLEQELASRFRP